MIRRLSALPLLLAFLAVAGFLPLAPAGSPHASPLPLAPTPALPTHEKGALPTHPPSSGDAPSSPRLSSPPTQPPVPPSAPSLDPSRAADAELAAAQASLDRGMGPAASSSPPAAPTPPPAAPRAGSAPSRQASPLETPTAATGDSWSELATPLPWHDVSMAYDAADGYVVEFGGTPYGSTGPFSGATWEFASGAWTQLTPTISPGERSGAAMVYDPADGVVLLFGGTNTWGVLGDTWEFKGGQWSETSSTSSPPARHWASMVFDTADGYVLLFGGQSSNGYLFDDTWTFKGGAWTELTPSSAPSGRFGSSLAFDAADGYVLLFSGDSTHLLSDTWEYLGGTWTNVTAQLPTAPPGRMWGASTWDSTDGYVLLYAGNDGSPMTDAWKYVAGAWTSLGTTSISGRYGEGLTYDPAEGAPLLFGGTGTTTPPYEAWTTFVWKGGAWAALAPAQDPAARDSEGLAYDVADGYVVLFGGITPGGVVLGDTWTYAGGTWTELESAQATAGQCTLLKTGATVGCPDPRAAASMIYDMFDQYVLLYGGWNHGIGNSYLGDTWEFTAGAWHELSTYNSGSSCTLVQTGGLVNCPPERYAAAIANYRVQGGPIIPSVILFGGNTPSSGFVSDTWQYANGWQLLTPTTSPSSREDAAMATDLSAGGEVLLFGGYGGSEMGDTWEFTGSTWSQQTPNSAPSARDSAGMADGLPVLLFGGVDPSGGNLGDSWSFRNGQWSQLPFATTPALRGAPGLVNDTGAGYDLLYGGGAEQDTWTFGRALEAVGPALSRAQVELGQSENFVAAGSEGGTGSYSYSWGGLPPGCNPSGTSASLSCTPTTVGTYSTNVVVDDSDGSPPATGGAVIFSVYPDPSTSTPAASPWSVDLGQTTTFSTTTTGGTGVYTWTWSGLPAGCSTSNTSSLSCRPTSTGSTSVSVSIKDTHGFTAASGTLAFTVVGDPVPSSLAPSKPSDDVNQPVTYGETPSGGASGYYRYAWSGLPSSCPSANTSALACTPTSAGTYPIWVTVSDANGFQVVSPTLSFVVHSNPSINLAENRTVLDLGQSLTIWGNASGGSGTYSIWYQGLPCATANVSTLNCVPTATGTFTVTAFVNDTLGGSSFSGTVSFTVHPDVVVTTWFARGGSFAYANQSLILQVNYSQGNPLYRPCVDAPGSILVGVVCGAPQGGPNYQFGLKYTQPGTYSITASVEDSTGWNTTVSLTETVYWPFLVGAVSPPSTTDKNAATQTNVVVVHGIPGFRGWWNDTTTPNPLCTNGNAGAGVISCILYPPWVGTHTVELTLRDSGGSSYFANFSLTANPDLHAFGMNATAGSLTASQGGNLQDEATALTSLVGTFQGGTAPFTTSWSLNRSGLLGSSSTMQWAWGHVGTYTLFFNVSDFAGGSLSGSLWVQVSPALSNSVLNSHLVRFDAGYFDNLSVNWTSGIAPFSFAWNFGDGATSSTTHPWVSHAWSALGLYTVSLTLTDAAGVQATPSTELVVVADPSVVNITARVGSSVAGAGGTITAYLDVPFDLDGLFAGGIGPYRMTWTMAGYGWNSSVAPSPQWFNLSITYSTLGTYIVKFNVSDAEGQNATASLTVFVAQDNIGPATLTAEWSPVDAGVWDNLTVSFAGGVAPFTYHWLVGGPVTITRDPWIAAAFGAGRGNASVTVLDAFGAVTRANLSLVVNPALTVPCAPVIAPSVVYSEEHVNQSVSCVTGGTGPYSYMWVVGPGNAGSITGSPWQQTTYAGAMNVTLEVIVNDSGGSSVASRVLPVEVLTLGEVTPYITGGTYSIGAHWQTGALTEVRLYVNLTVVDPYGQLAAWSSDLAPVWTPWELPLVVVTFVTSSSCSPSASFQVQNSLGQISPSFAIPVDLCSLFATTHTAGGPSLGLDFLVGSVLVVALMVTIAAWALLAKRRRTRRPPDPSSATNSQDISSEATSYLKEHPGATKDDLVNAVAEAKKMPPEDVETQLAVLVGGGKVVASGVNGGTTYRLPNGSNGMASEDAAAELDRQKAETEQALGLRRKEALDRLVAAIPEGAGYVPERMVREAVADLDMSDGEFWGYVGELKELKHWKVKGRKKDGFWFHRMVGHENAVPEPPRPRMFTLRDAEEDPPGPYPTPGPSLRDERAPEE